MEILSVTLKNFKGHGDRHFTFQPGTNAICGENGAGKTSILEAIAWTLFNYRGAYKTEDLIRNGAASAQVRVAFISNNDFRTYEISRCTRSGYTIFDPQLGTKLDYSRIEEEILPWLRQHLGVTPGTDLADLFANTIGVPQGLFTADFLKPERERKKTFDTILKVEEYRKLHDNLLPLYKHAETIVAALEADITRYDADLKELEPLLTKQHQHQQDIQQVEVELLQLQEKLIELQLEQTQLATQANDIQQLQMRLKPLQELVQNQTIAINQATTDLHWAEAAVATCTQHRDAYQMYVQAETKLNELQQQIQVERQLQQQKQQHEQQLRDRQTQHATLVHQLARLAEVETEIQHLAALMQQQINLEQEQQSLTQQLQTCASHQQAIAIQTQQIAKLQSEQAILDQEIEHIRQLEPLIQNLPELEQQQQRIQQQLSRIAAATQFEADLQNMLNQAQAEGDRYLESVQTATTTLQDLQTAMPLWVDSITNVITTLHTGVDWQHQLISALQAILTDLAQQTSATQLEAQLHQVQTELQTSREAQIQFSNLNRLIEQWEKLEHDQMDLKDQILELETKLAIEPSLKTRQTNLIAVLKELEDPRGRTRLLTQELHQQPHLQAKLETLQTALAEGQQVITKLDEQLSTFADFTAQLQQQQALKQQYYQPYQEYLTHRELANTRKERQQQLETATQQLQLLEQEIKDVTEACDRLQQAFDPQHFQAVQIAHQTTNTRLIALDARLPEMKKYLEELNQQLIRLRDIEARRTIAQTQLEQKRRVEKFIKFARKAYKDAGPRITERYLHTISQEADRLFRELLNRPNVGLEWKQDYEIKVQEGANTRRFVNLSGGEQMCAALAVRLALLRVLADIDIAFFDEPTTNMDRPRRESLAEAIANIKTFRQLFVISHDDTFEKVTENIIVVERDFLS